MREHLFQRPFVWNYVLSYFYFCYIIFHPQLLPMRFCVGNWKIKKHPSHFGIGFQMKEYLEKFKFLFFLQVTLVSLLSNESIWLSVLFNSSSCHEKGGPYAISVIFFYEVLFPPWLRILISVLMVCSLIYEKQYIALFALI